MPGMHSGLNVTNTVLVTAFRSAVLRQGLTALLVLATLAIVWASLREWRPGLVSRAVKGSAVIEREAPARRLLRLSFGLLWIFDGILQAQPAMAAGLPGQVMAPAARTSPAWVQHVVNWAGTAWSFHPVQAAAAAVWIQVGIGIWMLAAARGPWSRLAGLAGLTWGLLVWVFGEAFGGLLAPGLTVLFGAPGAALLYGAAGALVAAPDRIWLSVMTGRRLLACIGIFLAAMAVLQAWPGRGFWQGHARGHQGTLAGMVGSMAGTPQPSTLARLVRDFGTLTVRHGFAVNLAAVIVLGLIGAGLMAARPPALLRATVAAAVVFCLVDWVLVEDLGFMGGLGTDPNSMVPLLLVVAAGYLAVTRPATTVRAAPPARVLGAWWEADATVATDVPDAGGHDEVAVPRAAKPGWPTRLRPARLTSGFASVSATGLLAAWAAALVVLGAAPMAVAQASATADPIIARALDGSTAPIDLPAAPFRLTDQNGRPVSLASLRGKVVLLTFLDPVCTTDCPLIAQELRIADQMLGPQIAGRVRIVAVAANPIYYSRPYLQAFDRQDHMNALGNWLYLTGPLRDLRQVWNKYGITVQVLPGGQMIGHDDIVFVLDPAGRIRFEMNADPGAGTASSKSSFAVEFSQAVRRVLAKGHSQLSEGR
jgi:cytochrome oxidase Cu insertion factor (SCO1/SenC/PrrC family)